MCCAVLEGGAVTAEARASASAFRLASKATDTERAQNLASHLVRCRRPRLTRSPLRRRKEAAAAPGERQHRPARPIALATASGIPAGRAHQPEPNTSFCLRHAPTRRAASGSPSSRSAPGPAQLVEACSVPGSEWLPRRGEMLRAARGLMGATNSSEAQVSQGPVHAQATRSAWAMGAARRTEPNWPGPLAGRGTAGAGPPSAVGRQRHLRTRR
jgi:hypothetical protein